jgi:hypothetical protein
MFKVTSRPVGNGPTANHFGARSPVPEEDCTAIVFSVEGLHRIGVSQAALAKVWRMSR